MAFRIIFSKREVNFKLLKSAKKNHHCYTSDKKKEESRRKDLDEIFIELKAIDHPQVKPVIQELAERGVFNQIKHIRRESRINQRSLYILYTIDNFDMLYLGGYSKLCLHFFFVWKCVILSFIQCLFPKVYIGCN